MSNYLPGPDFTPDQSFQPNAVLSANPAERIDTGMEKVRSLARSLGRVAINGFEKVRNAREDWYESGETGLRRLGKTTKKVVIDTPARGLEKAARHIGGNLADNQASAERGRALMSNISAQELERKFKAETNGQKRYRLILEAAVHRSKESSHRTKAEAHDARAQRRRTNPRAVPKPIRTEYPHLKQKLIDLEHTQHFYEQLRATATDQMAPVSTKPSGESRLNPPADSLIGLNQRRALYTSRKLGGAVRDKMETNSAHSSLTAMGREKPHHVELSRGEKAQERQRLAQQLSDRELTRPEYNLEIKALKTAHKESITYPRTSYERSLSREVSRYSGRMRRLTDTGAAARLRKTRIDRLKRITAPVS
jgi:hypothetical protein